MSKQNNRNPNFYDSSRNHPGEGIAPEQRKQPQRGAPRRSQGKEGQPNFIPGEPPVGEKKKPSR